MKVVRCGGSAVAVTEICCLCDGVLAAPMTYVTAAAPDRSNGSGAMREKTPDGMGTGNVEAARPRVAERRAGSEGAGAPTVYSL